MMARSLCVPTSVSRSKLRTGSGARSIGPTARGLVFTLWTSGPATLDSGLRPTREPELNLLLRNERAYYECPFSELRPRV